MGKNKKSLKGINTNINFIYIFSVQAERAEFYRKLFLKEIEGGQKITEFYRRLQNFTEGQSRATQRVERSRVLGEVLKGA